MDNRFYLQALGVTGLFVVLLVLLWGATGGSASEESVQSANHTRTSIAMTGDYLLRPRTGTPRPPFMTPSFSAQTNAPQATSTLASLPSPTNTSLLAQLNTPLSSPAPSFTPLPTQTAAAQVPIFTFTPPVASGGLLGTRPPAASAPPATQAGTQDPAEFARWYFTRVWNERDYQNLWDNYLTLGFKANVGSGLFEDYVTWWGSVARVDIHAADVLANNGQRARVRVDVSFHMNDGRVVEHQVYEYDFLFDPTRNTWMFDAGS